MGVSALDCGPQASACCWRIIQKDEIDQFCECWGKATHLLVVYLKHLNRDLVLKLVCVGPCLVLVNLFEDCVARDWDDALVGAVPDHTVTLA
jgi:hypothetical protein